MNKLAGITWMILSLIISCINDSVSKYLDSAISVYQIIFCRFAFGAFMLLPIILQQKRYRTSKIKIHLLRGSILAIAMLLWLKAMFMTSMTITTMMGFTIPFFTLILAQTILKEKVSYKLWIFTFLGFTGAAFGINIQNTTSPYSMLLFTISATLFALLDIINKKLISQSQSSISMLFYSNIFSAFFILPFALLHWSTLTIKTTSLLILLGLGGNLILYCILKAYKYCEISYLAPLRYVEFILSTAVSYSFFNEKITLNTIIGAMVVFICSLVIIKDIAADNRK